MTFQMLQERFLAGLARRVERLSGCLGQLADSASDEAKLAIIDEMTRGFHSLAGIGGTYGFHRITDIARIGEVASDALDTAVTTDQLRSLADIVEALRLESPSVAVRISSCSVEAPPRVAHVAELPNFG
jgi:chemotaxis protein histidine kinase CheA